MAFSFSLLQVPVFCIVSLNLYLHIYDSAATSRIVCNAVSHVDIIHQSMFHFLEVIILVGSNFKKGDFSSDILVKFSPRQVVVKSRDTKSKKAGAQTSLIQDIQVLEVANSHLCYVLAHSSLIRFLLIKSPLFRLTNCFLFTLNAVP